MFADTPQVDRRARLCTGALEQARWRAEDVPKDIDPPPIERAALASFAGVCVPVRNRGSGTNLESSAPSPTSRFHYPPKPLTCNWVDHRQCGVAWRCEALSRSILFHCRSTSAPPSLSLPTLAPNACTQASKPVVKLAQNLGPLISIFSQSVKRLEGLRKSPPTTSC